EGGEAKSITKDRQADEGELAHPDGAARITVAVLRHREAAQQKCQAAEENKIKCGAKNEGGPVEILAFQIKRMILPGRDIRPGKKLGTQEQNRNGKHG